MPFQPDRITREHIIQAIRALQQDPTGIKKSTGYDLHFEGDVYPPKAVLRKAHEIATGEELWKRPGGPPTNDFLTALGFEIQTKNSKPDPLPNIIKEYKDLVGKQGLHDELYKWELIQAFKGRPYLEAQDLLAEFKKIKYANLIYGPGIGVIYDLARERSDVYRECLCGLFDESIELQQRMDRFTGTALQLYREIEPDLKRQPHHDERTIATLLTYHDPYKYAFYKDSFYRTLCKVIGEKPADPGKKYVDYLAIVDRFIDDYIQDDQELIALVNQHKSAKSFTDPNFKILAQDILYRMLEINGRTFGALVEEIAVTLADDLDLPRFSVMKGTIGSNKQKREWVWIADEGKLIGNTTAHYELEIVPARRDKIRLCLHFEDKTNAGEFEKQIGKALPEGLQWFSWFEGGRSLRQKKEIDFYGEQTITNVIAALQNMDTAIGDQVRNIITKINKEIMLQQTQAQQPLNQILFGPPGTGKTYHTVNKALQILGQDTGAMSRPDAKAAFDQLVSEQRIVFTSFHQSLGYEDFIEGFKPVIGDTETIQYEIKPGIFKTICNAARGLHEVKVQQPDIFTQAKFYKMSLGGLQNPHIHDWCLKHNCVGLGWGGDKNFSGLKGIKSWKEYRDKFIKEFPELVKDSRYNITAMYAFQQMHIGDIVVISKGNHIIDAIGKITGDYEWDDNNDFGYFQFRKVEWLATGLNQQPATFFRKQISQQSIYEFFDDDVKKEVFIELFKSDKPEVKPYVLIIDEINRGNISKIFGELITLIEPDKRLGNNEGLTVTLPYTRDDFGVPANLYIIGTMNTADRSVEALDTALRRRFSFEEMQPHPELLSPAQVIWRFFWKHSDKGWNDKDYLVYEEDVFQLLQPDDLFKADRKSKWDSFEKNGAKEEQIVLFQPYTYTGIDLERLLTTVNRRLEVLKDRDHLIGHAYFMNVYSIESLMIVFRDNLIPLLQEYFFGDYYKIQLVIGAGFISSETASVEFAVDDEDQFGDKDIFSINKAALADTSSFLKAIALMKI